MKKLLGILVLIAKTHLRLRPQCAQTTFHDLKNSAKG